uniref:Uncharacterized protein n=1 Tax=Bionectria ochroleuca TaxID=29856 RepID=A0A8H7KCC0_BIOOC
MPRRAPSSPPEDYASATPAVSAPSSTNSLLLFAASCANTMQPNTAQLSASAAPSLLLVYPFEHGSAVPLMSSADPAHPFAGDPALVGRFDVLDRVIPTHLHRV